MLIKRLVISLTGIIAAMFLSNPEAVAANEGKPLFAAHEVIEARVEAPLKTLMKTRPEEEYLDGSFIYLDDDGSEHGFDLKLQTRGRYRRQKSTCNFPPVRLNFRKGQVKGSLFDGQDKLKLVTHCQNRRTKYEQLVLREYLAYRILQVLTDASFSARLMHITWIDTEGAAPLVRYGFVIEDDDDIADRMGLEKLESDGLSYAELEPRQANLVNVFEYLIGNTDFSLIRGPANDHCCHNAVPFAGADGVLAVPYDFDFSGLVDAPYAEPNPRFKIRNVRTRIYRGRCSNNVILSQTLTHLQERKQEIYGIVDGLAFDKKNRKQVIGYLDSFYELAANPKKVNRELVKECS